MDFPFDEENYGKLARSRLKDVDENFRWYIVERIGEGDGSALKLTGATFREAKSGPRKGKLCVIVKGTQRVAVVSQADIDACRKVTS